MRRTVLFLIVSSIAAPLVYQVAIIPYRQNILKQRIESQFLRLETSTGGQTVNPAIVARIRENIEILQLCLQRAPTDTSLFMELAACYRFLGRYDEAIETYQRALQSARRPELYRNLAESQLAMGDTTSAMESYAIEMAFCVSEENLMPDFVVAPAKERAKQLIAQMVN